MPKKKKVKEHSKNPIIKKSLTIISLLLILESSFLNQIFKYIHLSHFNQNLCSIKAVRYLKINLKFSQT